jgi:hypothetical protein
MAVYFRVFYSYVYTLVEVQAGATQLLRDPGQNYCVILESSFGSQRPVCPLNEADPTVIIN